MLGILILSHENFGAAMIKSAELIMGRQEQVLAIGLHRGDSIESFREHVIKALQDLDSGKGVLVFTDLFGASPYNVAAMASTVANNSFRCITGFGLPMILEALTFRETDDLDELTGKCMEAGSSGIKELFEEMEALE